MENKEFYTDANKQFAINPEATVAFFANRGIVASTGVKVGATSSAPIVKSSGSSAIAFWGEDNLFPQTVLREAGNNSLVPSTIDWKARALYSGGIEYGYAEYDDKDEYVFKPKNVPVVDAFLSRSRINYFLAKAASDFYWFYNVFPEFTLTKDRKEIYSIRCNDAASSRWGMQNSRGIVDTCYLSANWENGAKFDSPETIKIAALDPFVSPDEVRELSQFKFVYPVSYPTPNRTFYQLAHWNSIRTSGWLDFANSIPQFKKALMLNMITVKYHLKIAQDWWKWKFADWEQKPELKSIRMETQLQEFNDFMSKPENAGKSVISIFRTDPQTGKNYPGWEIEAIGDNLKDGIYIEDSQEASSHTLFALGVHGSLIGSTPGKGMGGGSGSDVREAFNVYQSLCQIHSDLILEPLNFIRDYNGWDSRLRFRFRRPLLQTLDKVTAKNRDTKVE